MRRPQSQAPLWFLDGEGVCAAAARAIDWSRSSLGAPEDWPSSLKSTLAMLLHSRHPMFLWWGEELIQFYNDAYLPSFGQGKHPAAMGQRGAECWGEIWPIIAPQIEDVMQRGVPSWNEDHLVPIYRNGRLEEVYWTYGYSPVFGDQGAVAGTLVVCTETTPRVLSDRRLRALQTLAEVVNSAAGATSVFNRVATVLGQFPHDLPFALIFKAAAQHGVELAASVGLDEGARQQLSTELGPYLSAPEADAGLRPRGMQLLTLTLEVPGSPWPEAVTQVYMVPLAPSAPDSMPSWIVFGLSPRLLFDAGYREYLQHLAERIGQALARRHAARERARLLREVRLEQERLADLFAQAPAFMCVVEGPEHIYSLANKRYYELIGRRDIIGKSVVEVLPEMKDQGFVQLLDEVYRTGRSHFGTDMPVQLSRQPDQPGEQRFVDFVYQAFRGSDDAILGIVVHGIDQTKRHHAEQAMLEADRRKDEFLAILAHELRNPLAPINNYAQLLEQRAHEPAVVATAAAAMLRQVRQMARLIDDLLDVSRISSGKIELRRDRVAMDSVVQQAVDATQLYYERGRRQLEVVLPAQPIYIDADAARVIQIIGNLLHNAAKFTAEGGQVWLGVDREQATAVVRVRDDGIGIAPAQLCTIFQMFSQADTSLERTGGGLGIGLGLVRSLVELHGGTVEALSEGIGRGSEFVVRLPVALEASTRDSSEYSLYAAAVAQTRILIVDDNRDACDSMAQLLRATGHDAQTAYDGLAGVEMAEQYKPDVVLLDLGMPKLNGYGACQRIRAQPWGRAMTVVALTGWGQAEDMRRTEQAGFDAHLVKPVDVAALEDLLRSMKAVKGVG